VIDGELDDVVWTNCLPIDQFHQTRPQDKGKPSQKTEARLAHDKNFLYVAYPAFDNEMDKLVAKGLIREQQFRSDDRVAISLDTFNDRRNSYFFQVNSIAHTILAAKREMSARNEMVNNYALLG
jgi:hypothetical protein